MSVDLQLHAARHALQPSCAVLSLGLNDVSQGVGSYDAKAHPQYSNYFQNDAEVKVVICQVIVTLITRYCSPLVSNNRHGTRRVMMEIGMSYPTLGSQIG